MKSHNWLRVNLKLIPCFTIFVGGLSLTITYGGVRHGSVHNRVISLLGVIIFTLFSLVFLHVLTSAVRRIIVAKRLGVGRAAALQFILNIIGYLAILIAALDALGVPVGRILLGSAVAGIILGVAAQQALSNFFASIVLIISHPFSVGQDVTLISGALGGEYEGTIVDIELTHTRLRKKNGDHVTLPNSTLLTSAAIIQAKSENN